MKAMRLDIAGTQLRLAEIEIPTCGDQQVFSRSVLAGYAAPICISWMVKNFSPG